MWLHVRNSEGTITGAALAPGSLLIGRDAASDVFIADERASRQHSRLTTGADGTVWVEDLGSTNGTWVNGTRISAPTAVTEGDEIRVGSHLLQLTPGPLAEPAAPQAEAPATVVADAPVGAWPAPVPAAAREMAPPAPPVPDWGAPVSLVKGPDSGTPYATPYAPTGTTALPAAAAGGTSGGDRSGGRRGYIFGGFGLGAAVVAVVIVIVLFATGGGSGTLSPGKISAKWGPSTLYVNIMEGGKSIGSGSGWVYNSGQGLVVTNAHVIEAGTSFSVGQGSMKQNASVVAVDPCEDIAVLKVADPRQLQKAFKLGSQADVSGGDSVTALGYPEGGTETPSLATTTGVVSVPKTGLTNPALDLTDTPAYSDLVQVTASINHGNSGGPLLNSKGQLIGMNTAGLTVDPNGDAVQGEGFAIGVDRIKEIVPGLAAGHSIAYTGMDFEFPTSAQDFQDAGVPEVNGIIVYDAVPGSPAARAGFGKFGNASVITGVNGHNLKGSLVNYCSIVGHLTAGQSATFQGVQSDGSQFSISVPFE